MWLLWFTILWIAATMPQITTAEQAMGFKYDDISSCSSSVVEMDSLEFECNSNSDCTTGDEVTFTGTCTFVVCSRFVGNVLLL